MTKPLNSEPDELSLFFQVKLADRDNNKER